LGINKSLDQFESNATKFRRNNHMMKEATVGSQNVFSLNLSKYVFLTIVVEYILESSIHENSKQEKNVT